MPLEATMMIIDNSEYMRNGDYQPTRWETQKDAVNVVFQTKIDANPENTVGIMTMAGKGPEVLVTHSKDLGQILQGLHKASSNISGQIDIPTAIAIAQLALKHRENKNLRQRIIVFVASPLEGQAADEKAMVKLAKKLKKNNVAVDVVSYGDGIEETTGEEKSVLRAFVDSASSGDNSHLVSIPPGTRLLSDALISSPILSDDRSSSIPAEFGGSGDAAGASGSGGANQFEFGVDPSLDPELALVRTNFLLDSLSAPSTFKFRHYKCRCKKHKRERRQKPQQLRRIRLKRQYMRHPLLQQRLQNQRTTTKSDSFSKLWLCRKRVMMLRWRVGMNLMRTRTRKQQLQERLR
ncbi:hypothetical protein H2248_005879 [Termitomyces sp. 'cryptogamus']|nr:hypothetical protein H2248_005879 [Termitomyces sp. 'cryptogamus']